MRAPSGVSYLVACVIGLGMVACGDNIHPEQDSDDQLQTVAPQQVSAGDPIAVTCLLTENGTQTTVTGATLIITDDSSVIHQGDEIIAKVAGQVQIACSLPAKNLTDSTPAVVQIVAGAPVTVDTVIAPNPATAGDTVTATCTVYDGEGNVVPNQAPTLTITPTDAGNTITALNALMTTAGHYDGQCTLPGADSLGSAFDVNPGLPANLVLGTDPNQPVYAIGADIGITDVVTDQYGNQITGATVTFASTAVTGVGAITQVSPAMFSYSGEGSYEVDGAVQGMTQNNQPVTAKLDIIINSVGPKITCGAPADGTMINEAPGGTVTFTGTANDVNGTASVTVNGTAVALGSNGSFSAPLTSVFGINYVDVTATDTYGVPNTQTCTFLAANQWADPNSTYAGTVGLSLAQGAVDDGSRTGSIGSLGDVLYTIANSTGIRTSLNQALLAANPLKAESCDSQTCVFGECVCWYSSGINYVSSTINGPNTDSITLENGGLATTATINGANMVLNVYGDVSGIGYNTTGNVSISYITINLTLDTGVSGGVPHITVAPGSVSASVGSISTDFSGLDGWIINNIVVPLAQGDLKDDVVNMVENYISNNFDTALDGIVSGLDISSLGTSFNVPMLYGGGTVPLSFGIGFSSLDTTTARLRFGIATKMTSTIANAYATLGVAVPPGTVLGDPNPSPSDTAVAIHVALLNQALHALWRANYFTVSIDASSINSNAPPGMVVALNTRLPPVAYFNGTKVQLSLGDADLTLTGGGLPPNLVITIGARLSAPVTLSGNSLSFGALSLDETHISLAQLGLTGDQETQLQTLIQSLLPEIVSSTLGGALPSLPIPSFPIPTSLGAYGLSGTLSVMSPALQVAPPEFILRGSFGIM